MAHPAVSSRTGVLRSRPECEIPQRLRAHPEVFIIVSRVKPEWRNWYTHQTQNLARFTPHVGSSPTSGTTPHHANNVQPSAPNFVSLYVGTHEEKTMTRQSASWGSQNAFDFVIPTKQNPVRS